MKSFAPIVALVGLLFCLFSCDTGKSGPFTFTNNTGTEVHVLIDQDGITEKTFTAGEKYQGKDYFIPKITFVSETDKSVVDNRYTATTNNGFDYSFNQVTGTAINIMVNLPADFATQESSLKDAYLAEVAGKLGEFSTTTIPLNSSSGEATESQTEGGTATPVSEKLYTNSPSFRIYRDKTVDGKQEKEDISSLFTIALGKSELPPEDAEAKPTVQWNLKITYPKVAIVQN